MERALCQGKKRRSSDCERVLLTGCICNHCSANVLNLALVKSCAIPETHSTFDFIGNIASFLKSSSKRNARLTTAIKSMSDQISKKWRLHQPCQTRWTMKHSAVLAVSE